MRLTPVQTAKVAELLRLTADHVLEHPLDQDEWWIMDVGEDNGYEPAVIRAAISARDAMQNGAGYKAEQYASLLRLAALRVSGGAL